MLVIGEHFPHHGYRGADLRARLDRDALAAAFRLDAEIFGRAPRRDLDREEHGHDTRNAPRLHAFYVITAPSPSMTMASRLDQEKQRSAASRHGSHAKSVCSPGASLTGARRGSARLRTCSVL